MSIAGGSCYAVQFRRLNDGPMSAAERAKKKEACSCDPVPTETCCVLRRARRDRVRKRDAKERAANDSNPDEDGGYTEAGMALQQYRMKVYLG